MFTYTLFCLCSQHCADESGSSCDSSLDELQSSSIASLSAGECGSQLHRYTISFGRLISVLLCILYVIYFGSGGSCSYSSVGPPVGSCCTVSSHLASAEVNFS